tara:strand:- start:410 stop:1096 length:687 start_codon:yes stop_codon:yes gene_type:complete
MNLLLVTILPSIIILSYFIYSDKFKEPKNLIIKVFLFGVLICFPAGYLNYFSEILIPQTEIGEKLTSSFLGPAIWEEILKFLILYLFIVKKKEFNEPMDGIVYGVAASLGFATYENYYYVYTYAVELGVSSEAVAYIRAFSAVPMHGLNGCIMGFYFGQFVFTGEKRFLSFSLLMPFIFHGAYNFFIGDVPLIGYSIIIVMLIFSFLLHKNLKKAQVLKKKEYEKKII